METQIVAVTVIVSLGVIGTILVLNKRKAKAQATKNLKSQKRKKQK
jgi:preprotein translocase subunit SecG